MADSEPAGRRRGTGGRRGQLPSGWRWAAGLHVKIVIWPSDSGRFRLLTSVSAAIVSPKKKGGGGVGEGGN